MAIAAAQCAACPTLLILCAADAEGHQRRAVIQIDADPVPTHGLTVEVLTGPFVIEPSLARDVIRANLARDGTRHAQVRQAVVIARGRGRGTFAASTLVSVENNGLCPQQPQIESKIFRIDLCRVGGCAALERPMIDPNVGITGGGLGESQPSTADTLVLP